MHDPPTCIRYTRSKSEVTFAGCLALDPGSAPYAMEPPRSQGSVSSTESTEPETLRKSVDVAIIGNGPAAIFLSLLLSGYWPYSSSNQHPNPYLSAKLSKDPHKSILEQDLDLLSEGLEGRSNIGNPLSILLDTLMRPNADIGQKHPPTLTWQHLPDKQVSHLVIGSGPPGGLWHTMPRDLKTLSLGSWLELPGYPFGDWFGERYGETDRQARSGQARVSLGDIADYYVAYTDRMGLTGNFLQHTTIANVVNLESRPPFSHSRTASVSSSSTLSSDSDEFLLDSDLDLDLPTTITDDGVNSIPQSRTHITDPPTGDVVNLGELRHHEFPTSEVNHRVSSPDMSFPSDSGIKCCTVPRKCNCPAQHRWCLRGCTTSDDKQTQCVTVFAKKLVLACGVAGSTRKLKVPGEDLTFVNHSSADFHSKLTKALESSPDSALVIVGAGLSAADAIIHALSLGARVYHIFRRAATDSSLIYHRMSLQTYPHYRHIFDLMRGKALQPDYTPFAEHTVSRFTSSESSGGVCVVKSRTGEETFLSVSLAQVQSGSIAKLDFLPDGIVEQLPLNPDKPISIGNPVDVRPLTFESEEVEGLYVVGSLAGENFVRFVLGGALGVCQHLQLSL